MPIQPGQTYRSADPRELIRIRIKSYTPGENRALVVDAATGKRPRPMLVTALHESPTTQSGKPRRSGYVLEVAARTASGQQPETEETHVVTDDSDDPEHIDDCPGCEVGIEHTEHCPSPETHNWGCGCPTDERPAPAVGQPAEAQATDEARPPRVQWGVEYLRAGAPEPWWDYDQRTWDTREKAQAEIDRHAGSSVRRRLVREDTTWTVEDER